MTLILALAGAMIVAVLLVLVAVWWQRLNPPPEVRAPLLSERERFLLERRWRRHLRGPDRESCLTPVRQFTQARPRKWWQRWR